MESNSLLNISPIDGRYSHVTNELKSFFSEYAYIKYRLFVELQYLLHFLDFTENIHYSNETKHYIKSVFNKLYNEFNIIECEQVKQIEIKTKHDVKAIEYYIREKFKENNISNLNAYIHFGLTSQDINSVAYMLLIKDAINTIYIPQLNNLKLLISNMATNYKNISMLSRTHGQPASPTTLGKEIYVFCYRLNKEKRILHDIKYRCKFSGASGNWNAHRVAYPQLQWPRFGNDFINSLGLLRNTYSTQISNYDELSYLLDNLKRINTILIDFSIDIWYYISLNYFIQANIQGEIGSSTMPHKVNPINFENCEGNLIVCNSLIECLSRKLPVSRLQRDLTDSTILRNMGTIFGHIIVAFNSLSKGLTKIKANEEVIATDLQNNNSVIIEGIQTILRREGIENAYEITKTLCNGNNNISKTKLEEFIDNLEVNDQVKLELHKIDVFNYIGYSSLF